jgi:hypothetical protein
MNNEVTQARKNIALSAVGNMPMLGYPRGQPSRNDTYNVNKNSDVLIRISSLMSSIASTLGSIQNTLRLYVKNNENILNKQRYIELENLREARGEVTNKPGISNTKEENEGSLVTKALIGTLALAIAASLIPEETKRDLYEYGKRLLVGFGVAVKSIEKFESTIKSVSELFEKFLGADTGDMLKEAITDLSLLLGLSLLTRLPGRRGPGPVQRPGPGGKVSRGSVLRGVLGSLTTAAATAGVMSDESFAKIRDYIREALSLEDEEPETTSTEPRTSEWVAFDFFKSEGYTDEQAAGIVGNLIQESNLNPKAFNPTGGGKGAYGIAQWRGSRQDELLKFSGKNKLDETTLQDQLEFIIHELGTTEKKAGTDLKAQSTVEDATRSFASLYERPGEEDLKNTLSKRTANARGILTKLTSQTPERNQAPSTPASATRNSSNTLYTPSSSNTGTTLIDRSTQNQSLMEGAGSTTVTTGTLPASTMGSNERAPVSRPTVPPPLLMTPDLDSSLFFNPSQA